MILLFVPLTPTGGQGEQNTVYIVRLANKNQPPLFDEIVNKAESKLQEYDIHIEVVSDNSDKPEQFIWMSVTVNQEPPVITISPMASDDFQLPASPVLYPNNISPDCCRTGISVLFNQFELDSSASIQTVGDLITALGLYQVGEYAACETLFADLSETISPAVLQGNERGIDGYIRFYRANCAIMNGDFELGIDLLEQGYLTTASINLAWLYMKTGQYDAGLSLISEMEIPYRDPDFLSRRAQLYALAAQYDDAIADLNAAIELDPDNPKLYTLRGQIYLYLYEWDSVLDDYNHAIELDPTYAAAYYLRGVLYYSILQTGAELRPEALADFQHYLELAPNRDHAADAARYIEQIQSELDALNG